MNYLKVLEEKKLKKEDLSKGLQQKIDELELLNSKLEEFNNLEKLNEAEQEKINAARQSASELDAYLVKKIKLFDPVKHQKKIAHLKHSKNKSVEVEDVKQVEQQVEQVEQKEVVSVLDEVSSQEMDIENDSIKSEVKKQSYNPESSLRKKLDDLKKSVQVDAENFDSGKKVEEVEVEEQDEFDKVANSKPRKTNKGLILMGIGAFILTWGAVNFFKDRRG